MPTTAERVSLIESDLREIAYAQRKNEIFLEGFTREIHEFKDEIRIFEKEMKEFKDEMKDFKDESRRATQAMNKKWGDLANKMGTIVEDIILPGFGGVLSRYFQVEAYQIMPNVRRRHPLDLKREREFDVIALTADRIFLNETKSRPKLEYVREFLETKEEVFEYFPEYRDKTLVPVFSSLSLPRSLINYLTDNRCYALMMGEDHLEVVNFPEVAGTTAT